MKVAAVCARIVGAVIGVLLVPSAVLWLVEVGVAGSWKWLPACLVLVAGLAGCGGRRAVVAPQADAGVGRSHCACLGHVGGEFCVLAGGDDPRRDS